MHFPHLKPQNTIIPLIAEAAIKPYDPMSKAINKSLGTKLNARLADNWEQLPASKRKAMLRSMSQLGRSRADFSQRLWAEAAAYMSKRDEMARARTKLILREIDIASSMGIFGYKPSPEVAKHKTLMNEVNRAIMAKFNPQLCCVCCCEKEPAEGSKPTTPAPKPPKPRYGAKITLAQCHEQEDQFGNDDIYLITTAVDGNSNNVVVTSNKFNVGSGNSAAMNHWVYPPKDPGDMLDIAVSLYEDDGGYEDVADAISKLGGAISNIPDPWKIGKIAGSVISTVGAMVNLAAKLDSDDYLGMHVRNWTGTPQLDAATMTQHTLNYYDDAGTWYDTDLTDWNYDLTLQVVKL